MRNVALAALLELLEQAAETAVEHRAGRGAAENSAERAAQQIAEPATAAATAGQAGVDIAGAPGRLARPGVGAAHVLHRVDREQSQQRLGHRRHAMARCLACPLVRRGMSTRIPGGSAECVENIEQTLLQMPSELPPPPEHAPGKAVVI